MSVSPVESERPFTARVMLARLAEAVLMADPAVEPNAGLGRWLTIDGTETIRGVVATVASDGRVAIELHVDAGWPTPPLPRLADELRESLWTVARRAGLGDRLGDVAVSFHDIGLGGTEGPG